MDILKNFRFYKARQEALAVGVGLVVLLSLITVLSIGLLRRRSN